MVCFQLTPIDLLTASHFLHLKSNCVPLINLLHSFILLSTSASLPSSFTFNLRFLIVKPPSHIQSSPRPSLFTAGCNPHLQWLMSVLYSLQNILFFIQKCTQRCTDGHFLLTQYNFMENHARKRKSYESGGDNKLGVSGTIYRKEDSLPICKWSSLLGAQPHFECPGQHWHMERRFPYE